MGIFTGSKVDVKQLVTDATEQVDKLFLTKEEKLDSYLIIADASAKFVESTMSENTTRSKARRGVTYMYMGVYLAIRLSYIATSFTEYPTEAFKEVINDTKFNTGAIMILAFYYGGYYAKGLLPKAKNAAGTLRARIKERFGKDKED